MESEAIPRRAICGLAGLICLLATSCSLVQGEERAAPPPASEIALAPATYGDAMVLHPAGAILREIPGDQADAVGLLNSGSLIATTGRIYRLDGVLWHEVAVREHMGWVSGLLIGDPADVVADVLGTIEERDEVGRAASGNTDAAAAAKADDPSETVEEWAPSLMVEVYPGANIRSEPEGRILTEALYGALLDPTGEQSGDWIEVRVDDEVTGWIFATLAGPIVETDEDDETASTDQTDATAATADAAAAANVSTVTPAPGQAGANIRSGPGGAVLHGIPAGQVATATGNVDGEWIEVTYQGVTGWSFAEILTSADE